MHPGCFISDVDVDNVEAAEAEVKLREGGHSHLANPGSVLAPGLTSRLGACVTSLLCYRLNTDSVVKTVLFWIRSFDNYLTYPVSCTFEMLHKEEPYAKLDESEETIIQISHILLILILSLMWPVSVWLLLLYPISALPGKYWMLPRD